MEGNRPLSRWCLFAGTGVTTHWDKLVSLYLGRTYKIELHFETAVYAEKCPKKQTFLLSQHGIGHSTSVLVGDVAGLRGTSVFNLASNAKELLPHADAVAGGVPCVCRSSCNNNVKKFLNCVQKNIGDTGIGWHNQFTIARIHGATMSTTECVVGLWQRSDGSDGFTLNDNELMLKQMREELNAWAISAQMDAHDCGLWVCLMH